MWKVSISEIVSTALCWTATTAAQTEVCEVEGVKSDTMAYQISAGDEASQAMLVDYPDRLIECRSRNLLVIL